MNDTDADEQGWLAKADECQRNAEYAASCGRRERERYWRNGETMAREIVARLRRDRVVARLLGDR